MSQQAMKTNSAGYRLGVVKGTGVETRLSWRKKDTDSLRGPRYFRGTVNWGYFGRFLLFRCMGLYFFNAVYDPLYTVHSLE